MSPLLASVALLLPVAQTRPQISLPTPRAHHGTVRPGTSGVALLVDLLKELEPDAQKRLLSFALASGLLGLSANPELAAAASQGDLNRLEILAREAGPTQRPPIPKDQAIFLIKQANWFAYRPVLLEFFLHQSQVLDMVPDNW